MIWSNYGPVIVSERAKTAFGSHPCRGLSVSYDRIGRCHGRGPRFNPCPPRSSIPPPLVSQTRERLPERQIALDTYPTVPKLCRNYVTNTRSGDFYLDQVETWPSGCVKTVSEPLGLGPLEICFERKADSPSYCFFEKVVRKRRARRPGFCAPKAGALPDWVAPLILNHFHERDHTKGLDSCPVWCATVSKPISSPSLPVLGER